MEIRQYRIDEVKEIQPGKFQIFAIPSDGFSGRIEALQTFDTVTKYGEVGSKPQLGTEFLGVLLGGKVYILKYTNPMPAVVASQLTKVPKFYETGAPQNEGDWSIRQNPQSFIQFLTNGYLRLQASAESFIEMIPDLVRFSKIKDKLRMKFRNFVLETFGGYLEWTNFDPDGAENFKSEFNLRIHRGDPLQDLESKNNHIEIKAGSVTDDDSKILVTTVKFKRNGEGTDEHSLSIGQSGLEVISTINGTKSTLTIDGSGISTKTDGDINIIKSGDIYIGKETGAPDKVVSESKLKKYLTTVNDLQGGPLFVPTIGTADLGFDDFKGGL